MKNIIKRNKYFNEQSFWALNTFLHRGGKAAGLFNLTLNLLYKYHKYPVTATLWFKIKASLIKKNRFNMNFSLSNSNSSQLKLLIKAKNCCYENPNKFHDKRNKRCVIFVGYSFDGTIPEYDIYYIKELKKICDSIIYIMDNPILDSELDKIKGLVDYAEFRKHGGYDFGSWRKGLEYLQKNKMLNAFDSMIFANDSCYGPVYPFQDLLQKMQSTKADFWGLVDSYDGQYHLLSFFYYFTKKVFTDPYFMDFFLKLPKKMKFEDAWKKGEVSFTAYLRKKFSSDVFIPDFSTATSKCYLSGNRNPTVWPYSLLKKGFPLIKVKAMMGTFGPELMESRADVKYYLYEHNKELFRLVINDLSRRNQNDYSNVIEDFDYQSQNLQLAIQNKEVVSFDVFDTLLIRPFAKPTDLFKFLELKYDVKGYKKERILAEQRARKVTSEQEITIDEIYDNILPKYKHMKEYELEWEKRTLQTNNKVFRLYKQAIKLGKIVIVISDMYLGEKFLHDLLVDKGYKDISKIFVSSSYRKTKGSGDLYRIAINEMNITKKDIVHIGDNFVADVQIPRKIGITAYHIHKILDDFLINPANIKYKMYNNSHDDLSSSIHLAMISHRTFQEKEENYSYWNMLGYRLGGPLALGYLNFISKELVESHIDKALFVARDGWGLKKLYDKYYYPRTKIISGYVYLQRILGIKGLLTWCEDPGYLKILLKNAKKEIPSIIVSKNYEENIKEYKRYYNELLEWSKNTRDELYAHINNEATDKQNIAIIDMTTGAFSSYRFSEKILQKRLKLAIYTGTFKTENDFKYMTFSNEKFTSNDDIYLKLSELLLSSVEPLIVDLRDGKPVYAKEYGIRQSIYPEIYAGIESYVKEYLGIFGVTYNIMNDMKKWMELATYYFAYSNGIDDDFMKEIYETGLPGVDDNVKSMYEVAKKLI